MHFLELIRRHSNYQMPRLGLWANYAYRAIRPQRVRSEIVKGVFVDLDLQDDAADNIFYLGSRYEHPTLPILDSWASRGAAYFFDIGSNFGFFSFALLQRHPALRALALEPHPGTFRRLKLIAEENRLARLECLQVAASDRHAELPFSCNEQNSGASHILSDTGSVDESRIMVSARPFDEILAEKGLVDVPAFAKIDVEGHELSVLRGMAGTLKRGMLAGICIEINPENLARAGSAPDEVRGFLVAHGYRALTSDAITQGHHKRRSDNWFYERA